MKKSWVPNCNPEPGRPRPGRVRIRSVCADKALDPSGRTLPRRSSDCSCSRYPGPWAARIRPVAGGGREVVSFRRGGAAQPSGGATGVAITRESMSGLGRLAPLAGCFGEQVTSVARGRRIADTPGPEQPATRGPSLARQRDAALITADLKAACGHRHVETLSCQNSSQTDAKQRGHISLQRARGRARTTRRGVT